MSKPKTGNWDEESKQAETKNANASSDSNRPKTDYMDMSKPGDYNVRLVGPHVWFRKHFKPYRATVQDEDKGVDPAWQAGFVPGLRAAINVIDRADGKLKILEKGTTVFNKFAEYKSIFNKDPAGKDGPDFRIKVTIPMKNGQPNKLKTEYSVTHMKDAPFTDVEKKMFVKLDDKGNVIKGEDGKAVSNLWPLKEIYKSTPAEKLKEMWDALPPEKRIAPKKETLDGDGGSSNSPSETKPEAKPIAEKMEKAPAASEDMFADEENIPANNADESAELF